MVNRMYVTMKQTLCQYTISEHSRRPCEEGSTLSISQMKRLMAAEVTQPPGGRYATHCPHLMHQRI